MSSSRAKRGSQVQVQFLMVMAQAACPSRRVHSSGPLTWLTTAGPRLGSRSGAASCGISSGSEANRIESIVERAATSTARRGTTWHLNQILSRPRGLASERTARHAPSRPRPHCLTLTCLRPESPPAGDDDAVTVRGRDEARRHHHGLPLSPDPERAGATSRALASFPGPRAAARASSPARAGGRSVRAWLRAKRARADSATQYSIALSLFF